MGMLRYCDALQGVAVKEQWYTDMDFWGNIIAILVAIVGWIIAMSVVNKQHGKNLDLSREEFKKNLQIATSDQAIELLAKVRQSLLELNLYLIQLPGRIKMVTTSTLDLKLDVTELPPNLRLHELWKNCSQDLFQFTYYFESREVILFEFKEMKEEVLERINTVSKTISECSPYLGQVYYSNVVPKVSLSKQVEEELREKMEEINGHVYDFIGYMADFQTELQNAFFSELFDYSVPTRQPDNPQYKVLRRRNTVD